MFFFLNWKQPESEYRNTANLWDIIGDVCRDTSAPQLLDNTDGFGHWRVSHWDHEGITGAHWWLKRQHKKYKRQRNKNSKILKIFVIKKLQSLSPSLNHKQFFSGHHIPILNLEYRTWCSSRNNFMASRVTVIIVINMFLKVAVWQPTAIIRHH